MPKYCALLAITFILAVGCQSNQVAVNLPPPSFAGPDLIQPKAPPPAPPPPMAARPEAPRIARGAYPAAWYPRVPPRPWKWIVIHHSASFTGDMAIFDREHKAKGWDGVGYHFVIGNGTASGDGQVEVTARWPIQKWGAHAKTPDERYNDYGIGICLVGNFDIQHPTQKQLASLARLVAFLCARYDIPLSNVIGHRDVKPTDCPGRHLHLNVIRQMAQAASGDTLAWGSEHGHTRTASVELLHADP